VGDGADVDPPVVASPTAVLKLSYIHHYNPSILKMSD